MALEKGQKAFTRLLPQLLNREGQFALLHRTSLKGVYESFDLAVAKGYEQFGLEPFLVKKIEAVESTYFVHRYNPCPPYTGALS